MPLTREERIKKYPSLQLTCPWCHKEFVTDSSDKLDKRTRFCCAHCERQWWRKETRHPTHLTKQHKSIALADVDRYSHSNENQTVLINMVSDDEYNAVKKAMNDKNSNAERQEK